MSIDLDEMACETSEGQSISMYMKPRLSGCPQSSDVEECKDVLFANRLCRPLNHYWTTMSVTFQFRQRRQ